MLCIHVPLDAIGVRPADSPGTQAGLRYRGFNDDLEFIIMAQRHHNIVLELASRCARLVERSGSHPDFGFDTHHRLLTMVGNGEVQAVAILILSEG
jgi:hypothetical protein